MLTFPPPTLLLVGLLASLLARDPFDGRPFYLRASFGAGLAVAGAVLLGAHRLGPIPVPAALVLDGLGRFLLPYVAGFAIGIETRRASRRLWLVAFAAAAGAAAVASVAALGELRASESAVDALPVLGAGAIGLSVYAAALVVWAARRRARHEVAHPGCRRVLDEGQVRVVQAMAGRFFPPIEGVDDHAGRYALGEEFSRYTVDMPLVNRLALRLAVDLIDSLPIVFLGRPRRFVSLAPELQDRYLSRLEHSRLPPITILFLVFKTGLSLLYYDKPEIARAVGGQNECLGRVASGEGS